MLPVAISLAGSGLRGPTVAFIGWFGPRGLASVVFALIAFDELPAGQARATMLAAIVASVLLSVVAHGLSAGPLAGRYVHVTERSTDRREPVHPDIGDAHSPVHPLR